MVAGGYPWIHQKESVRERERKEANSESLYVAWTSNLIDHIDFINAHSKWRKFSTIVGIKEDRHNALLKFKGWKPHISVGNNIYLSQFKPTQGVIHCRHRAYSLHLLIAFSHIKIDAVALSLSLVFLYLCGVDLTTFFFWVHWRVWGLLQ